MASIDTNLQQLTLFYSNCLSYSNQLYALLKVNSAFRLMLKCTKIHNPLNRHHLLAESSVCVRGRETKVVSDTAMKAAGEQRWHMLTCLEFLNWGPTLTRPCPWLLTTALQRVRGSWRRASNGCCRSANAVALDPYHGVPHTTWPAGGGEVDAVNTIFF